MNTESMGSTLCLSKHLVLSPLRGDLGSMAPHTLGVTETVEPSPGLAVCPSRDLHPGVVMYPSESIPGDLAELSQRKPTQSDGNAFFKHKVLKQL